MKKFLFLVCFAFFLLLIPAISHGQQQLPDWVIEMKKPKVNFPELTNKFNAYWKDKMEDDKKNPAIESEGDEFPIKEEYGWLRNK